jgi:NADH-quinone oxidoreductase subunit G
MRVLARDHAEVDDGWLCDKGRFAYQAIHVDERITKPLVRDGGELREVSWERALESAAGLRRHHGAVGALVGGQATNEEGFLLARMLRDGLDSSHIDSRAGGAVDLELARALAAPALQATVADLEFAHTVLVLGCEPLDDAPILDLRIRKGVRRRGVHLVIATARPSALDVNARQVLRYAPRGEAELLSALKAALAGRTDGVSAETRALAELLADGGQDVVIVWGERMGPDALPLLLDVAERLGLAERPGAGLLEIPAGANGRGLREVGALPNAGPGYASLPEAAAAGRGASEMAQAVIDSELTALYLFQTDPLRDQHDRELWDRALNRAALVVAHASVLTEGLREHATVIFPAESYAEKDGTVVHPDGRLQRLRTAISHPGEVRAGWSVLAEIGRRIGYDSRVLTSAMAFSQIATAVPFYGGLTLEALGGRGVRWPEREEASRLPPAAVATARAEPDTAGRPGDPVSGDSLRLGRYRPIWASPEVEVSPALKFAVAHQQVELSPEDARRLGIANGEAVEVAQNGTRLHGRAAVRTGVPIGTTFLAEGIASDSANALTEPIVEVRKA